MSLITNVVFFFQAEDGIRDVAVTGVQTCALPISEFLGSLSVKRVPNSRLMDVSFESTDPQLAARIVNAHIASYIEQNFSSKYEATTRASAWLADQLTELKKIGRAHV